MGSDSFASSKALKICLYYTGLGKLSYLVLRTRASHQIPPPVARSPGTYSSCLGLQLPGPPRYNQLWHSTMETEYMALTCAAQDPVYLGEYFGKLVFLQYAITVYNNNMWELQLATNKVYFARTKHIGVCFHFHQGLVENNNFILKHVPTSTHFAGAST
ncbi:unnamed protein product, partial [Discosporangium mesarthrocarpum]